jgi:membrane protein implicated in regulation of membrane protease activity
MKQKRHALWALFYFLAATAVPVAVVSMYSDTSTMRTYSVLISFSVYAVLIYFAIDRAAAAMSQRTRDKWLNELPAEPEDLPEEARALLGVVLPNKKKDLGLLSQEDDVPSDKTT